MTYFFSNSIAEGECVEKKRSCTLGLRDWHRTTFNHPSHYQAVQRKIR